MIKFLTAAVIFAHVASSVTVAEAEITYDILSFVGYESSYSIDYSGTTSSTSRATVAGTITTDGTLGPLSTANIISFSWDGRDGASGATATLADVNATATTLSFLADGYLTFQYTQYFGLPGYTSFISDEDQLTLSANTAGGVSWYANSQWSAIPVGVVRGGGSGGGAYSYPSLEFAAVGGGVPPGVPEPNTVVLIASGFAILGGYRVLGNWRRRRPSDSANDFGAAQE